jgi:hypothetical protein
MHDFELTGRLRNEWKIHPAKLVPRSKQYVFVDAGWLYSEGAEALRIYFDALGLRKYVENGNHCTHFTWRAAGFLHDLHVRGGEFAGSALAVGEFHYMRESDFVEHSKVIAVTKPFRPIFLEPLTLWVNDGRSDATEAERISCGFLGL